MFGESSFFTEKGVKRRKGKKTAPEGEIFRLTPPPPSAAFFYVSFLFFNVYWLSVCELESSRTILF